MSPSLPPIIAEFETRNAPLRPVVRRRAAKPRTHFCPAFELPTLDWIEEKHEILALLEVIEVVNEKTRRSVFTELTNAVQAYRDALIQQTQDAGRAEDREADRVFAKVVQQLFESVALLSENERRLLDQAVPALPRFNRRRRVHWMADIERATFLILERLSNAQEASPSVTAFVGTLSELLRLFGAFWNARAHPMVVSSSKVEFHSTRAMGLKRYMLSLDYIARCAEDVADRLKQIRGPDANRSIFSFLSELDEVLFEYRDLPLQQLDGWKRSEADIGLGDDPNRKSADELAVIKLVAIVSSSIPDDLKKRLRPYFFDPAAVSEALKIHIAARNAAAAHTARVRS